MRNSPPCVSGGRVDDAACGGLSLPGVLLWSTGAVNEGVEEVVDEETGPATPSLAPATEVRRAPPELLDGICVEVRINRGLTEVMPAEVPKPCELVGWRLGTVPSEMNGLSNQA